MWDFKEEDIILNQSFESASQAIAYAGEQLVKRGYVSKEYIAAMQERHRQVSVYIGNFVALPHADNQEGCILKEGIVLIQVPDGVDFGSKEKRQIATVIIAVALKKWTQLTVLQELSLFFSDLENVRKMSDFSDKSAILRLLQENQI